MGKLSNTTDANGWTWIFRNNNNYNSKPIDNPHHRDLEKVATSFYVSNLPDSLDAKGLWNACVKYGCLVDSFIANKRSKGEYAPSKPSFASVFHNKPTKIDTTTLHVNTKTVTLKDQDLISVEDSSTVLLLKLKDVDTMSNMYTICKSEGSNAFKKVACMFSKFMFFEAEESTTMSSGRVCISTRSHYWISEKVNVEVHGELFDVHVHELGTWSTSITDNSLDTFSNVDVNNINKVEDVVEENPIDDLNDLNDNLNDLA
ncbi:hypothetical protein Tco_1533122 [Tanacetum coccineum]